MRSLLALFALILAYCTTPQPAMATRPLTSLRDTVITITPDSSSRVDTVRILAPTMAYLTVTQHRQITKTIVVDTAGPAGFDTTFRIVAAAPFTWSCAGNDSSLVDGGPPLITFDRITHVRRAAPATVAGAPCGSVVLTPPSGSTTPIMTPQPPAPTPSSGTSTTTSSTPLLADDFTTYATTAAFLAKVTANVQGGTGTSNVVYTDGRNAQLASIDETVTYNGHHTLKYSQPGGTDISPELWVAMPKSTSHVWVRVHIRFSPGFITTGTLSTSSNAYKLLGWDYPGVDGSGRLEITNTTQYDFYWGMNVKNTSTHAGGGNHTNAGQISTEWSDGAWYTYIIEIDNTQKTAVTRFYWARGTDKPVLRGTTTGTMDNGSNVPNIDAFNFGMNFNQVRAANQNQALWYGDWEIVDGSAYADPFGVK